MKGNLKKIAAGGVSIGLAVALLATSLTSHKPVQALDVFSDTKNLVKASSMDSFDIVELISERSSFPTVLFDDKDEFAQFSEGQVHIGKEELAYMVGGEEPFANFWKNLSVASWMVASLEDSIQINTEKDSLIAGLVNAGLLDINDLTGYPLKISIGENFVRPDQLDKILDNAFLEVMKYPNDESNSDVIGYFMPMEEATGCYMWNADKGKMEYVGARLARADAAMHIEFQSGWNSNYIGDWELEEDLGDEYEYDEFWDEYEYGDDYTYDYEEDYSYDPGYEHYQNGNDYTFIEDGDVSEGRIVEYYYPDEEYTQSSGEVEIPIYQAGFTLGVNLLDETEGSENNGEVALDEEEAFVGDSNVMYNFYSQEEIVQKDIKIDQFKCLAVTGDDVGDLRIFRYIILSNNEWLKTQVFGIEESADNTTNTFADYPIHVYSVTTKDVGEQDDETIKHNLKATDGDELSRIIASSSGTETFSDSVKLFYIAQLPGTDISKNLRNNILNRVADNTMACIVNDANIHSILGTGISATHPTLQNLISYLYQEDLAETWDITAVDTTPTPAVEEMDRVNVDGEDVAHFVRKNVYAVDGSFVNPGVSLYDMITQGVDEGFDEVAYRIEQENYQREQDSQIYNIPFDRIDGVTRALAIQYILTYTDSDMVFQKASIRVLELQPCYDFTYAAMDYLHPQVTVAGRGNEARISAFKKEILGMSDEEIAKGEADPDYGIQVEIVGMTTSEFCGRIEDINVEYDMIYWGSNIGTFNKCLGTDDQKMHTVFNDYDMIGNVYTHVGDVSFQWPNEHILGLLDVNSITQSNHKDVLGWIGSNRNAYLSKFYRYSGNDILATQVDKLVSFLDAGYPIIVADDFFVDGADAANYPASFISSSDTVVSHGLTLKSYGEKDASWLASNASQPSKDVWGILDTSSYVYQFVNEIVSARDLDAKKYQNFMTVSQTTASEEGKRHFSTALNRPKIQINMISQPIEYTYSEVPVSGVSVIDAANSLAPEGDGKYYLEYEFYISNASGTSSTGATYGAKLYVDTNMDGKYVSDELMTLSDVVNLDANLVVPVNSLQDGTYYRIRRELPKEYIGAVPWKLEILDVSNQNVRGSVEGLSAVKEEKRELYICQFVQNRGGGADYTFIGENKVDGFRTRSGAWTALLQAVPDFNIHVISVDANDYFQTNGSLSDDALKRKYNRLPENVSYNPDIEYDPDVVFDPSLEGYDMLMFGFTEGFLENNSDTDKFGNQVNMGRVMRFIQSEKSVLFTHDTTAAFNRTSNNNSFNILIRDMGGMDRYGITIGKGTYDGQNPIEKEVFNQNKMRRGLVQATSKEELEDKLLFNGLMSDYKRDIAFKPGTNQTTMASETIALTASAWDSARRNTSGSVLYRAYDYDSLGVNRAYYGTYGRYSEGTKRVSKVNSGAITEYPYKLDDIIPISTTHGQYYQLDMDTDKDGDGEGDMVVWYTIENYHSSLDGYNISPHDVRNNYYIFTKDNITYSGSGDTRVEAENEIKLFINTMVAAYRVGTKAPDINLVSDPNTMMIKTADSIPYDPDVYDSSATYPVYFQVKDNNLLADDKKKVYYKAYLVDQSGSQSINLGTTENPKNINVTEITQNPTYAIHVGNQVGTASLPGPYGDYGYNIVNEEVYRIDLPLSLFTTQDVIELYIEGRSEIEKKQKTVTSEAIFTKYTISKMQLFDMD